jgi:hypothetical protein
MSLSTTLIQFTPDFAETCGNGRIESGISLSGGVSWLDIDTS